MNVRDYIAGPNSRVDQPSAVDQSFDGLGHGLAMKGLGTEDIEDSDVAIHDRIEDVFNLVSDTSSQIYNLTTLVKSMSLRMTEMQQEINSLRSIVGRTEAVVSSTIPQESQSQGRDANNTRAVNTRVPAAIITSLWLTHHKGKVFPVKFDYMCRLCAACFGELDTKTRSDIGVSLSFYIDQIGSNGDVGNHILTALSGTQTQAKADMMRNLMGMINLLGTYYAFMLPIELSSLLNRVNNISVGEFILADKADEDSMVCPYGGFNRVAEDVMYDKRITKALGIASKPSHTRMSATKLCKSIESSTIDSDGKYIEIGTHRKPSAFNTSSTTQTNTSTDTRSLPNILELLTPIKSSSM